MAFQDRIVQYPGRFILTNADTGEELGTFDLTRAEGEVTNEGTPLTAENLTSNIQGMIDSSTSAFSIDSSQNVHFRNLQTGRIVLKPTAAKTTTTAVVTFPRAFTKTPNVIVTPYTVTPNILSISVSNTTTTSIRIHMYRTTKVDTTIGWLAFV